MTLTLADVLVATKGRLIAGQASTPFRGIAIDSRLVNPGNLFVALPGGRTDGHAFVAEALCRGALGALVQSAPAGAPWTDAESDGPPVVLVDSTLEALAKLAHYWRCRHHVEVVAVTGSVGKTSTRETITNLLRQWMPVLGTRANLNTEIGVPLSLMDLDATHRAAVIELAMYDIGEIRHLARISAPSVGVVTNVQPSHLERLGSLDRIAQAKGELVEELPPSGLAVLHFDDPRVRAMAHRARASVLTYGTSPAADLWARDIESRGLRGVAFTIHYRDHQLHTSMRMLGAHSVQAALAAVGAAVRLGIPFAEAVDGLGRLGPGPRLVAAPGINGSTILDDTYNANPASMIAALDVLRETEGRHVAVLGNMLELGPIEDESHRLVGRRAAVAADWLLTVGPRARTIVEEAVHVGMDPSHTECLDGNDELVARLSATLQPGDVVLLKGSRALQLDEVAAALRTNPA